MQHYFCYSNKLSKYPLPVLMYAYYISIYHQTLHSHQKVDNYTFTTTYFTMFPFTYLKLKNTIGTVVQMHL